MNVCIQCKSQFEITDQDRGFYRKMDVPDPVVCPSCRSRWRMAFRNERILYSRKCSLCAKVMVSIYSPNAVFPVYCTECFWSDKWDPMKYGLELNLDQPFFE